MMARRSRVRSARRRGRRGASSSSRGLARRLVRLPRARRQRAAARTRGRVGVRRLGAPGPAGGARVRARARAQEAPHRARGPLARRARGAGRAGDGARRPSTPSSRVGANVWLRELEPSRAPVDREARALLAALVAACRRVGRFPARALRIGSDDEARAYFEDFDRFARTGRWASADGRTRLPRRRSRTCACRCSRSSATATASSASPECGERFVGRCGGRARARPDRPRADDGGPAPDHMGMVTSGRVGSVWDGSRRWTKERCAA